MFRFALVAGVPTECGALLIFTQNIVYCAIAGSCFATDIPVIVVREKRWMYKTLLNPAGKREFRTRFWEGILPFFFFLFESFYAIA